MSEAARELLSEEDTLECVAPEAENMEETAVEALRPEQTGSPATEASCTAEAEESTRADVSGMAGVPTEAVKTSEARYPMVWHGFLVWLLLWVEAVYHGLQAWWIYQGGLYYEPAIREAVYTGLPQLRMLDLGLAAGMALAALLCAVSSITLGLRRRVGPVLLKLLYLVLLLAQAGHALARYCIAGLPPLGVSAVGLSAVYLALLWINGSYYRKRRSAFGRRAN